MCDITVFNLKFRCQRINLSSIASSNKMIHAIIIVYSNVFVTWAKDENVQEILDVFRNAWYASGIVPVEDIENDEVPRPMLIYFSFFMMLRKYYTYSSPCHALATQAWLEEEDDLPALNDEEAEVEEDENMEPIQNIGDEPQPPIGDDPSTWDTLPADLGEIWLLGGGTNTPAEEAAVVEPSPEVPSKEELDAKIKELEYLVCIYNVVLMEIVL